MLSDPNPRPKSGRPRALDDVKRREVVALISAGCGLEGAANYVGCAASTIRREAARNPQFNGELRRANLTAELNPLQAIREAARKYWRAGAWLLERMNPQRFAKQNVRYLKPEHLDEYVSILASILKEEVSDPETFRRIARRFDELAKQADRDAWADRDPLPRPRCKRQSKRGTLAFPPPPPIDPPEPENPAVNAQQST